MEIVKCTKCSADIPASFEASFCPKCGATLPKETVVASPKECSRSFLSNWQKQSKEVRVFVAIIACVIFFVLCVILQVACGIESSRLITFAAFSFCIVIWRLITHSPFDEKTTPEGDNTDNDKERAPDQPNIALNAGTDTDGVAKIAEKDVQTTSESSSSHGDNLNTTKEQEFHSATWGYAIQGCAYFVFALIVIAILTLIGCNN